MFLGLKPKIAVITNVEHDHPDCYPTAEDFFNAFDQFAAQVNSSGTLLVCANDGGAVRLGQIAKARGQKVLSYSIRYSNNGNSCQPTTYMAEALTPNSYGGLSFDAACSLVGSQVVLNSPINLKIPGRHNVQNAMAALAVAHQLNLPIEKAARALSEFRGTGRRFEVRGEVNGITVIDDYAHHPTEIRATLSAARMRYPKGRLWVVWQPHTFSRTRLLFNDFVSAFDQADHVLVTDIYAAREKQPEDGFSAQQIVDKMTYPGANYLPDFSQAATFLVNRMIPGDVLIVLSAGDADQISTRVLAQIKERSEAGD
jgi:UDP-N-acetylmuramate--alanine ligase